MRSISITHSAISRWILLKEEPAREGIRAKSGCELGVCDPLHLDEDAYQQGHRLYSCQVPTLSEMHAHNRI